jgi:oligopeptide/dipeptide ABC transporter ATP-binding protein
MLEIRDLDVRFGAVRAVDGLSLAVPQGPYGLGLVGESGSGKTTVGRAVVRLVKPTGGSIAFDGADVQGLRARGLQGYRGDVQMVFQDPDLTLDPRMSIGGALREAMQAHRITSRAGLGERVDTLLRDVGLDPALAARLPHQLSGGQRQRVAIARALSVEPRLVVLDEPTSALDVTVQARILELIQRLRESHGLAYLLISHNLAVVEQLCDEIAVMYRGQLMEQAPTGTLLGQAAHPYTRALLAAIPSIDGPRRAQAPAARAGAGAAPYDGTGCPYRAQCPLAVDRCATERPEIREIAPRHRVACHVVDNKRNRAE